MKKKDKQASELLTRIYRSEGKSAADVENELSEIQEAVRATSSITFQQELGYFFNWKLMRRCLSTSMMFIINEAFSEWKWVGLRKSALLQ